MDKKYYAHISAEHKPFDLKLGEVWRARELIYMFTKRSFAVSYKQTILGPAWLFINPLLTSLIYVVLFGNIARLGTDGVPQLLFYFSGTAIWAYFSGCLTGNANTFTGNAYLFGKVYFPRLVMPVSNVLSSVIKFAIQMILVVVLLVIFVASGSVHPNWPALILIPVVLIWLGVLGMGLGILISSLTTKYRDLQVLVSFGMQLWLYGSPVVYPMSTVAALGGMAGIGGNLAWLNTLLLINPVSMPIEIFRYALLGVGSISMWSVALSILVTVGVAFAGVVVFNKVERNFMDTV